MNERLEPANSMPEALDFDYVHPRYKTQLRIELSLKWLIYIVVLIVVSRIASPPWHVLSAVGAAVLAVTLIVLLFTWAPRRYQLTGYVLNPTEVHYRTGALWRKQVSVPVNRIQHVEISQGVIERGLKLAKLVIYTAGGSGSDLAVPGLPLTTAEALRSQLLRQVNDLAEQESDAVVAG